MHAHPTPASLRSTANDRLKQRSGSITSGGIILAVAVHFAVFAFFPQLTADDFGIMNEDELVLMPMPDAPPLPPEPERIARPMNPVFSADAPVEQTIVPIGEAWDAATVIPAPPVVERDTNEPGAWVPHTVRPRLINEAEVQRALQRQYPPTLRDAGIGGQTTVWLLVSEAGMVVDTRVAESSNRPLLDRAALEVAGVMRFSPALNRDRPVQVWVALPIRFEARLPQP